MSTQVTWSSYAEKYKFQTIGNTLIWEEVKNIKIRINQINKHTRAFNIPKQGENISQDSYLVKNHLYVVSDWASNSIYSDIWSNILCKLYIAFWLQHQFNLKDYIKLKVSDYEKIWYSRIKWPSWDKVLPYYTERKLAQWSSATLCWYRIKWNLLTYSIIWDSCIFLISETKKSIEIYPINKSSDFWSNPVLISTKKEQNETAESITWIINLKKWDIILLCTDWIAKFIFEVIENFWKNLEWAISEVKKLLWDWWWQKKWKMISDTIHDLKDSWYMINSKSIKLIDDDSTCIYHVHK